MNSYRLLEGHCPEAVTSWSCTEEASTSTTLFTFNLPKLVLQIGISFDLRQLTVCQVLDINGLVRRRELDPIRQDVRQILHALFNERTGCVKELDLEVAMLQALERISELEKPDPQAKSEKGWGADEISDWNAILENPYGLDISTIRDTASSILGKTPEELVKDIPSSWRVIHMESVLRPDFAKRFWSYGARLRSQLEASSESLSDRLSPHSKLEGTVRARLSRADIIEDMVRPRVTFHGTPLKNVASIVRHGFLMPGRFAGGEKVASPRSGIAFDRGIYSSQAPSYALSYAHGQQQETPVGLLPSMRLFVCATIMGRTYRNQDSEWKVHGPLVEGYDSHFDADFEYIVHDERAILPCYVIHLDLGSAEAKRALEEMQRNPYQHFCNHPRIKESPRLSKKDMSPGDLKRDREAKKAAAMKWFPYGFGTAQGTQFQILEIAEVDDDEEEYGDWQADKHEFVPKYTTSGVLMGADDLYDDWDEEGNPVQKKKGLFMDQYQSALRQ